LAEAGLNPYTIMGRAGRKLLEPVQRYIGLANTKQTVCAVYSLDEVVFSSADTARERIQSKIVSD
jgi:hypothetical protein